MSPCLLISRITPVIFSTFVLVWSTIFMMFVSNLNPISFASWISTVLSSNSGPTIFTWEHTSRLFDQGLSLLKWKHFSTWLLHEYLSIIMTQVITGVRPMKALFLSRAYKNKCDLSKHMSISIIWIWAFLNLEAHYFFMGLETDKLFCYITLWSFTWWLSQSIANLFTFIIQKPNACDIVIVVNDWYFSNLRLFICKLISGLNSMVSQFTQFLRRLLIIPMELNTFKDSVVIIHSRLNTL